MGTAFQFLTVFLKKCGSKQEDVDYRPLFENFLQVQDYLLVLSVFRIRIRIFLGLPDPHPLPLTRGRY
jgi:hypothetical protein